MGLSTILPIIAQKVRQNNSQSDSQEGSRTRYNSRVPLLSSSLYMSFR
jgi:hypothetical protein